MPKLKIKGAVVPRHKMNPYAMDPKAFDVGKKLQYIGKGDKFIAVIDKKTGEIQTKGTVLGFRKFVDKQKFVKIYAGGIAALLNLSSAGKRIFAIIYDQVQNHMNTDRVILKYRDSYKISKPTFYKGLKECLERDLIAQTEDVGIYFINLTFFYNGNRVTLLQEYNVIEKDHDLEKDSEFEAEQNAHIKSDKQSNT